MKFKYDFFYKQYSYLILLFHSILDRQISVCMYGKCDGNEELILTITDGRNVSFFGSMKNVFNMISEMILF